MKKISHNAITAVFTIAAYWNVSAQCASNATLGTASNMFTVIRNSQNPVAADKDLNMIAFIHRNNATAFGGSSGNLRYDISTNAGTTWSLDIGVLNPLLTNLGRYPNMAIYNPSLNTTPGNAYVSYMAATISSVSSAWNGLVTGVKQVGGTSSTESYNQPVMNPQLIPHSLVKGAPGVFWAIDLITSPSSGFAIYKGTWSSSINDIVWVHNYSVTPTFNAGPVADYNIAFDPTGQYGWFSTIAKVNGTPTVNAYYPVFWKTTDGGASWTGPITADLNNMGCFSTFVTSGNVPSAYYESDLVVDTYGNPHLITTILNSSGFGLYFNSAHWMYDITLDQGIWAAHPLGSVLGSPASWGTSPDIVTLVQAPHAARTADGSKVFFTWVDNTSYSLGNTNTTPNLFTKAYDVVQKKWTATKDVTSCNSAVAGKMLFPHLAAEVLQPSSGNYKLAPVYTEFSVAGSPVQVANFLFLDNVTYSSSEFSVALPSPTVSIAQGSNLLLCPGSTVNVNVTGAGEAIWNTGVHSPTIAISSGTTITYIVTAQKDCVVGKDTITVSDLTFTANATSAGACPGGTVSVGVAGNATSYTWMPGSVVGSTAILVAGNTPNFTLNVQGTGCITQQTVAFNLLATPTISILGPDTACSGNPTTYTATGGSTYEWTGSFAGDVYTIVPTINTSFSVIGTAANSCTNSVTKSILVISSPTLLTSQTHTAVCPGQTATLVSLGASSYTWNTGWATNALTVSPVNTETYMVTGIASNGCPGYHTFTVVANAAPSVSVQPARNIFCKGEKMVLTASGAASYTWASPYATTPSVQISPTVTSTYTVTGKTQEGCTKTFTYSQVVSPCTGIGEQSVSTGIRLYPNPTRGSFVIESQANEVLIHNQLGQLVRRYGEEDFSSGNIVVKDLSPGLYFVSVPGACRKLIVSE